MDTLIASQWDQAGGAMVTDQTYASGQKLASSKFGLRFSI
jgi:hypothetical protein